MRGDVLSPLIGHRTTHLAALRNVDVAAGVQPALPLASMHKLAGNQRRSFGVSEPPLWTHMRRTFERAVGYQLPVGVEGHCMAVVRADSMPRLAQPVAYESGIVEVDQQVLREAPGKKGVPRRIRKRIVPHNHAADAMPRLAGEDHPFAANLKQALPIVVGAA